MKYHTTLEGVILYIIYHNTPVYIINITYLTLNVKMKKKFAFTVHIHIPVIMFTMVQITFTVTAQTLLYFVELKNF